jgi:hypothetical protein
MWNIAHSETVFNSVECLWFRETDTYLRKMNAKASKEYA